MLAAESVLWRLVSVRETVHRLLDLAPPARGGPDLRGGLVVLGALVVPAVVLPPALVLVLLPFLILLASVPFWLRRLARQDDELVACGATYARLIASQLTATATGTAGGGRP